VILAREYPYINNIFLKDNYGITTAKEKKIEMEKLNLVSTFQTILTNDRFCYDEKRFVIL
jgi:hypothetical protein